MQELVSNIKALRGISPAAITATTAGQIIDMQGYEAVLFVVASGTVTTGDYTPHLEHGSAANLSDAADVTDADMLPVGTGQEAARIYEDADDDTVVKLGYRGKLRYVRCNLTEAGTANALMACIALQFPAARRPVS